MKFSSQEEYGLRCLLQLARRPPGESMTIPEMSQAEGMTQPHVAKVMRVLKAEGFVKSVRGKDGGYSLSRPAKEIILADVLGALGGKFFDEAFCGRHTGIEKKCNHSTDCSIRSLLFTLQRVMDGVLSRISLQDLLRNEHSLKRWIDEEATPKALRQNISA